MANLIDTATANGNFTTLLAAAKAAGLVETLNSPGPFTIFAPNDAAFAKLPGGTVEALLNDIPKLTKILTYHVVAGKVMAADVVKLKNTKTVEGSDLQIHANGGVKVNEANVIATDIAADNGVIHVVDSVIMPN